MWEEECTWIPGQPKGQTKAEAANFFLEIYSFFLFIIKSKNLKWSQSHTPRDYTLPSLFCW